MTPKSDPQWVATQSDLDALIGDLDGVERVALDTEFHGERSYVPHLMLVQVGTEDDIWLVDPLADIDLTPLFEFLAQPVPLVIGHALHNDLEIIYLKYGVLLQGVFDTQIAASFLGYGLQIGLTGLLREIADVRLPKGAQMADWSRRPLPERQWTYAANDVRYLPKIHHVLATDLAARGRTEWVAEECLALGADGRYGRDPQLAYLRVSGYRKLRNVEGGVLVELAAEREHLAAAQDTVPHFLLSDDVLTTLARRMPLAREDLNGNRRLNNRNVHRYADRWIAAVERGKKKPLARPPPRQPTTPGMDAAAALLMLMVNEVADRESLAPQLLLRRKTVQKALLSPHQDKAGLLAALGVSGWRAEQIGGLAWDLLDGRMNVACERDGKGNLGVVFRPVE
ncbi:MAG: ribonuclease D [Myxococcales bacterium]|nr:ribonuclease D [Myxococcales bacterium]